MNYTIATYKKGALRKIKGIEAKSPKQALRKFFEVFPYKFEIYKVIGKTINRFDANGKLIKDKPKFYKATLKRRPVVLMLFGNLPEAIFFMNEKDRNEAYTECTKSTFVEYANPVLAQTSIIVSIEGTYVSKNTLIQKKTSNGSVTNATCKEKPTPAPIATNSGNDNAEGSVVKEWTNGSQVYHSEPVPTLTRNKWTYGQVALPDDYRRHTTFVTRWMKKQNNKIMLFKKTSTGDFQDQHRQYLWSPRLLSFTNLKMYIFNDIERGQQITTAIGQEYVNKTLKAGTPVVASFCPCGCHSYTIQVNGKSLDFHVTGYQLAKSVDMCWGLKPIPNMIGVVGAWKNSGVINTAATS